MHGFAAVLGARYRAPHGAVCGALLPAVVATNLSALRAREPEHPALARIGEIAGLLTGGASSPDDAAPWLWRLRSDLGVPGLAGYGVAESDIPSLVEQGRKASSMKGNPLVLQDDELAAILTASL